MIRKLREARENEEGFTLIELLVVVIIIGILAAIAIPAFLSQRDRAYQAELTSGVRNFALEIESAATASGGDAPASADLPNAPAGTSAGGDISFYYTEGSNEAFVLCGQSSQLAGSVTYDNTAGGLADFNPAGTCSGTALTDPEGTSTTTTTTT